MPRHKLIDAIEHRSVEELTPYANNARTHSPEQIEQIASSITEFGFVNPVLIGPDNVLVAGHGRLLAAQQLGMKKVPVIVLGHLTDTQRRALVIADNQLAQNAGWNYERLASELDELRIEDFNVDLLGFDDKLLENLTLGFEQDSYDNKNKEMSEDDFSDMMELKFKLTGDQYEAVRSTLRQYGDNLERSLLKSLDLEP